MPKIPEIYIPRPTREIVASTAGVTLDGSLDSMRGTDCTEQLQNLIDRYTSDGNLKLILDGVALVHDLKLRSNLHIQGCGPFTGFSHNYSNNPYPCAVRNANWQSNWAGGDIIDHDITISDLTINGNRENEVSGNKDNKRFGKTGEFFTSTRFYGVRNFRFDKVRIIDPSGFAVSAANLSWFSFTDCDFIHTEFMNGGCFPDIGDGSNTDGIHINGPASDGIISNIKIATGDDGIALNASDGGRNCTDEPSLNFYKN